MSSKIFDHEDFKFLSFLGSGIVAVVVITCFVGYLVSRAQCRQIAERSGYATDYRGLTGCFIHVGDTWVPYDRWRVLDEN